jgi:hypothetical protein
MFKGESWGYTDDIVHYARILLFLGQRLHSSRSIRSCATVTGGSFVGAFPDVWLVSVHVPRAGAGAANRACARDPDRSPAAGVPRLLLEVLPARVSLGQIGWNDIEPADLDARFLQTAKHLRQSLLDVATCVATADLQDATDPIALLLEPHQDRAKLGRLKPDQDLPVATRHRSMHRIQDLLADTLRRGTRCRIGSATMASCGTEPSDAAKTLPIHCSKEAGQLGYDLIPPVP